MRLVPKTNEHILFLTCLPLYLPAINPKKCLIHHWILILVCFACGWMMTSIFPSSAPSVKDLAAAYVNGLKKKMIPKNALELSRVINVRFPFASVASNLSIQFLVYLSCDLRLLKIN
jgi:hypothetical protein